VLTLHYPVVVGFNFGCHDYNCDMNILLVLK